MTPLQSLIATGTKVWLDSIDPDEVARNRAWGITGATSNPIIVADLIKTGRFNEPLGRLLRENPNDKQSAPLAVQAGCGLGHIILVACDLDAPPFTPVPPPSNPLPVLDNHGPVIAAPSVVFLSYAGDPNAAAMQSFR